MKRFSYLAGRAVTKRGRCAVLAVIALGVLVGWAGPLDAAQTGADERLYMEALGQYHGEDYAGAAEVAMEVIERHADSDWHTKARFLRARALVALKRFKEAEAIYEKEAARLLAGTRKREIAGVVVAFADRLATPADPKVLDAPPPDFGKAYKLYDRVLQMEIGRELRDEVMFKKARAIQQAGNAHQVIADLEAYLGLFDPRWSGPAGAGNGAARPKTNPPAPGAHIAEARYFLAMALRDSRQLPRSRWEARDLLARLTDAPARDDALAADTRWLLVTAFGMPQPQASELERAVKATRDFLKAHHADPRAVKAAYLVPQAYENHGRPDQAIAQYQAFIDGGAYALPDGEAAHEPIEPKAAQSATEYEEQSRREALYKIGQLRFAQRGYDDAIAAWQRYGTRFPNGPHWAASQQGILNAEFQKGVQALADKEYATARTLFESFLRAHPLDSRARQILFTFGQIHHAQAGELADAKGDPAAIKAHYQEAIDEWSRLISKYPNTEESSLALFRSGSVQEEHLDAQAKALATFRRLTWGSYAGQAQQRIAEMTRKNLKLSTERRFRTSEMPTVQLKTRNIEKVTVRTYRLNVEAYFRKIHATRGVEELDVSLIEPDRTWELDIDGYAKYKPLTSEIEIPFEKDAPGAYVVTISEEDWEATTLVIRSDLDLIVKTSRRQALVFVQNRLKRGPAKDVKVLLSDGEAIFGTGTTGKDGVYTDTFDVLKELGAIGVLAVADGHVASHNLNLEGLGFSSGLAPRGYIYTARPVYRPGEHVAVRGILRDVIKGSYTIPTEPFTITVTDAQGRMIREEEQALSEFGTFATEFDLAEVAGLGAYTVRASLQRKHQAALQFTGTFEVQRFKLEKIRLALDLPRDVYFRGETVAGTISASYYWGEPVANAPLRYQLPDGRSYTVETDAKGEVAFVFDTTAMTPGQGLAFTATLTAENVSTSKQAFLALLGFTAEVKPSQPLIVAGEPVDVEITTTAADGTPSGRELTLSVLRRIPRAQDRVLDLIPWLAPPQAPPAETTVQEHAVVTDVKTGTARLALELPDGGDYILRVSGPDRHDQTVTADATLKVSGDDDATRLRFFAKTAELKVGARATVKLHSRMEPTLTLLTYEGEEILRYEVVDLAKGYTPVRFEVGHDLFPNFRISAATMDGRDLRTARKDFTVKRQLNVTVRPIKQAYRPGEQAEVEITVTDQLGQPVEAELSLALVNEALFAAYPDRTPPILAFFQDVAKRHAEFRVGATCAFRYEAAPRKVIKEVLAEGERLQQRRQDTRRLQELQVQQSAQFVNFGGVQVANAPMIVNGSRVLSGQFSLGGGVAGLDRNQARNSRVTLQQDVANQQHAGYWSRSGLSSASAPRREVAGEGFWLPGVVTDAKGQATVELAMPQTTTEWRLTARGCTPATLVGQGQAQTLTRKDFFVEIKAPAAVREGDTLRVLAKVHNLTDYTGPVAVTLDIGATGRDGNLAHREANVTLTDAGGATVVFEGVKVPLVDGLQLQVTARAGGRKDMQDALELAVPVRPWGMEYAAHAGGVARGDATALLRLPKAEYTRRWLTVTVAPALQQAVLEMALSPQPVPLPGPRMEPSGQSPGSELLAAASALEYGRRSKAPAETTRALVAKCRRLTAGLVAAQRSDGGWSWHGATGKVSDWPSSCRTFWGLVAAREAGIAVHPDTIKKATTYLQKRFQSLGANDHEGKAVILHGLSVTKAAEFASLNRLYRARNELGTTALAYTALAFLNQGRPEIATELAALLEAKTDTTGADDHKRVYWKHAARHPYLHDDVETTALSLLVLAQTRPKAAAGASAADYLLGRRGCFGWNPAKARGPAIAALAAWFGEGDDRRTDYRVAVRANDKEIGTIDSTQTQQTRLFEVPDAALVTADNRVTFSMQGHGAYAYAATLRGFSPELKNPRTITHPYVRARHYYHAQREYRGRPIGVRSTSPVRHLESGQRVDVLLDVYERSYTGYLVIEEPLPAGTMLVEGSVSGDFARYEVGENTITFTYQPNQYAHDIRYELVGYAPGDYRTLPTVMRDGLRPHLMNIGPSGALAVLAPGEASDDPYRMNKAELYKLGQLHFNDGLYGESLGYLAELFKQDDDYNERELARMLLWIYTADEHYEAARVVQMFEILRERYPELEIPYDRILVVGKAYRDIGEFERAWLVYRATISASFVTDSSVSAVLEDEGRFLGSIDYQKRLWREYPDSAEVVASLFALSQALYSKAPGAADLPEEDGVKPDRITMLTEVTELLYRFLAHYPDDPLADDAAFSLANAMLDLKNYPLVVALGERFEARYTDSPLASSFRYLVALGHFWQRHYDKALDAGVHVAEGTSKDKTFAQYIVGQIHHARNNPGQAIEWYEKVQDNYPDAAQAIAYFREKDISMDEVKIFTPGEKVFCDLSYRNIKEAYLQVYRVDLMKLYLQEKNLSNITRIQLAGISPGHEVTVALGDGEDYADKTKQLPLALTEEGAYLIICRGDDLFTSGLVLVTPLTMEVQEDSGSGRVRVNVRDTVDDVYCPEVHVKAIGAANTEFKDGETDLRGIFIADAIRGEATVIARDAGSRYAFYRGDTWLGAPKEQPNQPSPQPAQLESMDYQKNLRISNDMIQSFNIHQFDQMRRSGKKGVQVKAAF
ncbi:MAG: outer membrane protein assembly factor BamD [Verrucomicrobia bacterium]|nr:outer membrane protein assembly factor BamD [Verrucomicrobiota bacterium]MBT7067980.1 outer membrane protein assembly factor BamD [Verrucomicrobiota bacterium]MBT7699260.1 outer membrane protein assembly factor BamD [Verrucomicrobiota bacterium]